jgi:transcriptional regulator with XRE-family HTH domain
MATTKNFVEVIRRELADNPTLAAAVDDERFRVNVGAEIFEARTHAGLSQKDLAELAGMQQSAIARLEDADYDGHSLKVLRRIADALGKRLHIAFVNQYPIVEVPQLAYTLKFPTHMETSTFAAATYLDVTLGGEHCLDKTGWVTRGTTSNKKGTPATLPNNRNLVA